MGTDNQLCNIVYFNTFYFILFIINYFKTSFVCAARESERDHSTHFFASPFWSSALLFLPSRRGKTSTLEVPLAVLFDLCICTPPEVLFRPPPACVHSLAGLRTSHALPALRSARFHQFGGAWARSTGWRIARSVLQVVKALGFPLSCCGFRHYRAL